MKKSRFTESQIVDPEGIRCWKADKRIVVTNTVSPRRRFICGTQVWGNGYPAIERAQGAAGGKRWLKEFLGRKRSVFTGRAGLFA
jgi:hypothetical protein